MERRQFIAILVATPAVWPILSQARARDRIRKVGVLWGQAHDAEWMVRLAAFSRQLQKLGWMEGKNISFEIRHAAGNPDQFPAMATELVGTSPDVILAGTAGLAAVARKATGTIPIVVVNAGELEGTGLIASLRRPGGNVTGALVHRGRQRAADQPVLESTFRAACICHEARSPSCVPGPTRPA